MLVVWWFFVKILPLRYIFLKFYLWHSRACSLVVSDLCLEILLHILFNSFDISFSEFKFFAKKQFQSFQWICFYCWKYWFLVFILIQAERSVLNGKSHCRVGWVISGWPVILGYTGSFLVLVFAMGILLMIFYFQK